MKPKLPTMAEFTEPKVAIEKRGQWTGYRVQFSGPIEKGGRKQPIDYWASALANRAPTDLTWGGAPVLRGIHTAPIGPFLLRIIEKAIAKFNTRKRTAPPASSFEVKDARGPAEKTGVVTVEFYSQGLSGSGRQVVTAHVPKKGQPTILVEGIPLFPKGGFGDVFRAFAKFAKAKANERRAVTKKVAKQREARLARLKKRAEKPETKYGETHREKRRTTTLVVRKIFKARGPDYYHSRVLRGDGSNETRKGNVLWRGDFETETAAVEAANAWLVSEAGQRKLRKLAGAPKQLDRFPAEWGEVQRGGAPWSRFHFDQEHTGRFVVDGFDRYAEIVQYATHGPKLKAVHRIVWYKLLPWEDIPREGTGKAPELSKQKVDAHFKKIERATLAKLRGTPATVDVSFRAKWGDSVRGVSIRFTPPTENNDSRTTWAVDKGGGIFKRHYEMGPQQRAWVAYAKEQLKKAGTKRRATGGK